MGNRIDRGRRQQPNLANGKPLAQFQKLYCRQQILPRRSLAQKIDSATDIRDAVITETRRPKR
jgi:hypothetical protein